MPTPWLSVKDVLRREQLEQASAARAHRSRRAGLFLIWLGAVIWLPTVAIVVLWFTGVDITSVNNVLAPTVLAASLALITRGRRMRVAGAERVLADDKRAPIVYLRPFDTDHTQIATRMYSRLRVSPRERFEPTYEQRLARTLRKAGPFVAVGDPTERLPELGAARVYAADADWQETVDELTERASMIVMHAGETEGVSWEVHHVIALAAPERVILSLPLQGKRKQRSRQERYEAFLGMFGHDFPQPLPDRIGDYQFLYFDADWAPLPLGERGAVLPDGDAPRAVVLGRLAREFRITWAPLWVRTTVYCAGFFGSLALFSEVAGG